ncbi:hypothetical protein DL764_004495 [Monosporascus ibericus]|uniref:Major facilitator superfamily (MFS) profile domain-containing protein n=1 Tax=Monosporascus ibericus TaxID=155417 RepID=A0A4Q4TCG1_9PEZI|nr:hypothetical protein DL764_004495 [Monosporascus ibericus]
MSLQPENQRESADIVPSESRARQNTTDEKINDEDPESLRGGGGQTAQIDPEVARRIAANVDDFMKLVSEANDANERERHMKLSTALKVYPKAIGWSMVLSSCLIMEGYQTSVVGSYTAYPAFLEKFGTPAPNGKLQIPANWQNGITGAKNVGEILGLQVTSLLPLKPPGPGSCISLPPFFKVAGWTSELFGYRWTILPGLMAITAFIFFPFFAPTLAVFLVGEFFQGMAWGIFQTMTTAYAAEVCPVPLRHYLTAYVNLCWIIGQFISSGVLVGFVSREDEWGYKIPFALQWIWPLPIAIGTYLAPESPWWCVRKGHKARAEESLKRLARSSGFSQREADAYMAYMIYTDQMEKQVAEGTKYVDCFRGVDGRRTEIVCMTWIAQTMSGTALGGLSTFFYQQAGISDGDSFRLTWGQNGLNFLGTVFSWFVLERIGRKTLMLGGMAVMFVLLVINIPSADQRSYERRITGFMGIHTPPSTAEAWAAGTMVLLMSATANFSVGPVVYTIVSEMPSTRLRAKSIILARNAYNAINIAFVNVVSYRQINPAEWNWGPKSAFFWAGINALFWVYLFFRLPETKGRTYAELDILFKNKVPARRFAKTRIETLMEGTEGAQKQQVEQMVKAETANFEHKEDRS